MNVLMKGKRRRGATKGEGNGSKSLMRSVSRETLEASSSNSSAANGPDADDSGDSDDDVPLSALGDARREAPKPRKVCRPRASQTSSTAGAKATKRRKVTKMKQTKLSFKPVAMKSNIDQPSQDSKRSVVSACKEPIIDDHATPGQTGQTARDTAQGSATAVIPKRMATRKGRIISYDDFSSVPFLTTGNNSGIDNNADATNDTSNSNSGHTSTLRNPSHRPVSHCSLLNALSQRASHGTRINANRFKHFHRQWRTPSWLSVQMPPSITVQQMCWDPMGVLLAVACDDNHVRVYDWDTVAGADQAGRRQRSRSKVDKSVQRTVSIIPPIITFRIPSSATCMMWNPYNMDQLVVGLRSPRTVHIYQVDIISDWLQQAERHRQMLPPRGLYVACDFGRRSNKPPPSCLHFINETTLITVNHDDLICWRIPKSFLHRSPKPRWKWTTHPNDNIVTCVQNLDAHHILVGTTGGRFVAIRWERVKTVRFMTTTEHRPEIVCDLAALVSKANPSFPKMGVQRFVVHSLRNAPTTAAAPSIKSSADDERGTPAKMWGRIPIRWISTCGWSFSTILSATVTTKKQQYCIRSTTLQYSSRKVQIQKADGKLVSTMKWSMPLQPIRCSPFGMHSIAWTNVPDITQHLAHHDKYVLHAQSHAVPSQQRSLLWSDCSSAPVIHKMSVAAFPNVFAFHPNGEWVVMAFGKQQIRIVCKR